MKTKLLKKIRREYKVIKVDNVPVIFEKNNTMTVFYVFFKGLKIRDCRSNKNAIDFILYHFKSRFIFRKDYV